MPRQIDVDQQKNHVWPNFKWAKPPTCCEHLQAAFEEQFLFVSNFVFGEGDSQTNGVYMLPVTSEGFFARDSGIVISNCPWCGSKISVRKQYKK